jgi:hypothetical protein
MPVFGETGQPFYKNYNAKTQRRGGQIKRLARCFRERWRPAGVRLQKTGRRDAGAPRLFVKGIFAPERSRPVQRVNPLPPVCILNLPPNAKCCGARRLRRFRVASPQINRFVHFHSDGEAA